MQHLHIIVKISDTFKKTTPVFFYVHFLFPQSVHTNVWNFVGGHHQHFCKVAELGGLSLEQQQHIALPWDEDKGDYSSCLMYDMAWDNYSHQELERWNRSCSLGADTKECEDWSFFTDVYRSTITSEVRLITKMII